MPKTQKSIGRKALLFIQQNLISFIFRLKIFFYINFKEEDKLIDKILYTHHKTISSLCFYF